MLPGMPPQGIARARRATFFVLTLLGTLLGSWLLTIYLSASGWRWAEVLLLLCFIRLYYQLNGGFWTALVGVWLRNRPEDDPLDLWKTIEGDDSAISASTAIIIPVYNEDVTRVWEGLRVTYESLAKTGQLEHYDFYVLSDSDETNEVDKGARQRGWNSAASSVPSARFSTASAASRSTARAAMSPTSAAAGASATVT